MAGPFRIASGAVGVADIFSTCLSCFDHVQIGRRCGNDSQIKLLTLTLLKSRLSRWGSAVNIYDGPFWRHSEATQGDVAFVQNTLRNILGHLAEAEEVSNEFRRSANREEDLSVLTRAQMDTEVAVLDDTMRQQAARRQKVASPTELTPWALYDSDQCTSLIISITRLIDDLEQAFPARETLIPLVVAEVQELRDGVRENQSNVLRILHDVSAGFDRAIHNETRDSAAARGISIGSMELRGNARARDGNFYSSAWRGETNVPRETATVRIGSIRAEENARIMNGDTYGGNGDNFWD